MFTTLKRFLSKFFPQKLATETFPELPEPTPVSVAEVIEIPAPVEEPQQVLLTEPAPEPLQVIEEPVQEKKKKKSSKKKSSLRK